jgi:hypothetical protein
MPKTKDERGGKSVNKTENLAAFWRITKSVGWGPQQDEEDCPSRQPTEEQRAMYKPDKAKDRVEGRRMTTGCQLPTIEGFFE